MDHVERTWSGAVSLTCKRRAKNGKLGAEVERSGYRNALSEERKGLWLHFTHMLLLPSLPPAPLLPQKNAEESSRGNEQEEQRE